MELTSAPEGGMGHVAALMELAAVPVVSLTLDLTVLAVNRSFLEVFGDAATALVGRSVRSVLGSDDQDAHDALTVVGEHLGDRAEFLRNVPGPGGRRLAARIAVERVRVDGTPIGLVATIVATEPLSDAASPAGLLERRWRTVLDQLPLGVLVLSGSTLQYANPAALEILGCASVGEAARRVHRMEHVRVDERPRLAAGMARIAEAGGAGDVVGEPHVWHIVRPDGTERIGEARTLTVPFDDGQAMLVSFVDMTEQATAVEALRKSEARLHSLLTQSPVGIFETDATGRCVFANERWTHLTGLPEAEALDWGWIASIHPGDRDRMLVEATAALTAGRPVTSEVRLRRPDGEVVHAHVEARPLVDDAGTVTGWLSTATDLTAQIVLRNELAESEARFRDLADGSLDVVLRLRMDPIEIDYVSPSVTTLTGVTPAAYRDDPSLFRSQIHPEDLPRVIAAVFGAEPVEHLEFRLAHRDGTHHVVEARMHRHRVEGRVVRLDANLRDITRAARLREHLRDLSRRDPLTGLLNRRALIDVLRQRVARREPTSLLFIDLDEFKSVNDTLGHEAGDEVLVAIAGRLEGGLRAGAVTARFAGDEFVVVLEPEVATEVANRLRAAANRPIVLRGGSTTTISMSIGVAELDLTAGHPVEDLLHRADDEMYRAKRSRALRSGPH